MRFYVPQSIWFIGLLSTSLIGTCHGQLGVEGDCFSLGEYLDGKFNDVAGIIKTETTAVVPNDLVDSFLATLIGGMQTIVQHNIDADVFSYGYGDYSGDASDQVCGLGCEAIPMKDTKEYGILALKFPIPTALQSYIGISPPADDMLIPQFCTAFRAGETFTFGLTMNDDAITTALEAGPATTPIQKLISAINQLGVSSVSVAMSTGNHLEIPVEYYDDGSWVEETFNPNLSMSIAGGVELPFLPDRLQDIVSVEGTYTRSFRFNNVLSTLDSLLAGQDPNLEVHEYLELVTTALGIYQEAVSIDSVMSFDFSDLTQGLFQGLEIGSVNIHALKLPTPTNNMDAGLYLKTRANADLLENIKNKLCDELDGVLESVSGSGCKDINLSGKGNFGLAIKLDELQIEMDFNDFAFECKVKNMDTNKPKLTCDINGVLFEVLADVAGFVINVVEDIGSAVQEVGKIAKSAVKIVKGFRPDTGSILRIASGSSPKKLLKAAMEIFGGTDRETVGYNFVTGYKCEGTKKTLFTTRGDEEGNNWPSLDMPWLEQGDNAHNRGSCLTACYLWYLEQEEAGDLPDGSAPCCSYEKLNSGDERRCKVGLKGRTRTTDESSSATKTFHTDFEAFTLLEKPGGSCTSNKHCLSGLCDNGQCKVDCDSESRCFPDYVQPYQKCNGDDNSCYNMHGEYHYCDPDKDTCKACGGEPSPDFDSPDFVENALEPGVYMFQTAEGRYAKMKGSDNHNQVAAENFKSSDADYYKFQITHHTHQAPMTKTKFNVHAARNMGRDKYVAVQGENIRDVKADDFNANFPTHVFQLRSMGNCDRYQVKFMSNANLYQTGSDRNFKGVANAHSLTLHVIRQNYFKPLGSFNRFNPMSRKTVSGWACDADTPTQAIKVRLFFGGPKGSGVPQRTIFADTTPVDSNGAFFVQTMCGGTSNHFFEYVITDGTLLQAVKDGDGKIWAYGVDSLKTSTVVNLQNSPQRWG